VSNSHELAPDTLVLAQHPERGWLLINRASYETVQLSEQDAQALSGADVIMRTPSTGYVSATLEITNQCNLRCVHCYMGNKRTPLLTLSQKQNILTFMERQGPVWLTITGGEPLLDPDFEAVYRMAWKQGFVISILTNGLLLGQKRYLRLFSELPPFHVSVSLYGASEKSYRRVTQRNGGWKQLQENLAKAAEINLRLGIKVILLKDNEQDLDSMCEFASRYRLQKIITDLVPTVEGDLAPLKLQCKERENGSAFSGCDAESRTFFVTAEGTVCPCAAMHDRAIPLEEFARMQTVAQEALLLPNACKVCPSFQRCGICPPTYRSLTRQGSLPCPMRCTHADDPEPGTPSECPVAKAPGKRPPTA
jgi:MoaA/NifB/PqqE/SkfB family radical SAM enzyme